VAAGTEKLTVHRWFTGGHHLDHLPVIFYIVDVHARHPPTYKEVILCLLTILGHGSPTAVEACAVATTTGPCRLV